MLVMEAESVPQHHAIFIARVAANLLLHH